MASFRGWRFGIVGFAAVILGSLTTSVTAPAYFDPGDRTQMASQFDNAFVISFADYSQPACDILLPMVREDRVANDQHLAFRPMAIKERASRSAVRPTALSGWRSGRVRHLAA